MHATKAYLFSDPEHIRRQLRKGLVNLPKPKNDYEIVVPDTEGTSMVDTDMTSETNWVEDAADVAEKRRNKAEAEGTRMPDFRNNSNLNISHVADAEWRRQSQSVQRDLPRPLDVNHSVMRPAKTEPPLSDLQKAEEMIKREMLLLLHYDAVQNPSDKQLGLNSATKKTDGPGTSANIEKHQEFLRKHHYETFDEMELQHVGGLTYPLISFVFV